MPKFILKNASFEDVKKIKIQLTWKDIRVTLLVIKYRFPLLQRKDGERKPKKMLKMSLFLVRYYDSLGYRKILINIFCSVTFQENFEFS
jgi:hypothetical protein